MEKKKRITGIAELQFVCCCLIVLRHSDPLNGLGIQEIGECPKVCVNLQTDVR